MRQLDLFGAPMDEPVAKEQQEVITVETPKAVVEIETTPAPAAEEEPLPVVEEPVVEEVKVAPIGQEPSTLVFDDGKISVKIKPKAPPAVPVADPPASEETAIVEEPQQVTVTVVKKRGRKSFKEMDAEGDSLEIPSDEELFKKQYYSISQVAKWFNVNNSLLRYWENEFDVLKPRKNRKGDRMFRPEDIKTLQVIYYLLRQRKFTIEGAKEYMKVNKDKAGVNLRLIESLTKFKAFLLELKVNLEA